MERIFIMRRNEEGFTLVELAIVLVILGLLAAGVTAGTGLITAAERRGVMQEVEELKTSVSTFLAKYDQLPGDFSGATTYFTSTAGVINGDNNGRIEHKSASANVAEGYQAWVHMASGGVMDGSFTSITYNTKPVIRVNIPPSKVQSAGYFLDYSANYATTAAVSGKNILVLGIPTAAVTSPILPSGALKAEDAAGIDNKIDDGNPQTGTVRGMNGTSGTTCVTGTAYNVAGGTGTDCVMTFGI